MLACKYADWGHALRLLFDSLSRIHCKTWVTSWTGAEQCFHQQILMVALYQCLCSTCPSSFSVQDFTW